MNYILKPSLEHIALIKVAVTLWSKKDIGELMAHFSISLDAIIASTKWSKIVHRIKEKISQLPLPALLKEKMLHFIKPIGIEIIKWLQYYAVYYIGTDLPDELCWTQYGTIDDKKTAEILIAKETIDIALRYKLACASCLEKAIPKLWNEIPEDDRKSFCSEDEPQKLVVLWTHSIKGEEDKIQNIIQKSLNHGYSFYQYAFETAARDGNKPATEYFLQKLTSKEKTESIIKAARLAAYEHCHGLYTRPTLLKQCYSNILCILLSQMDKKQQIEFFQDRAFNALICWLDWPFHVFFPATVSCTWNFLSGELFSCLLRSIIVKLNDGFNYGKLFEESWKLSSNAHKRQALNGHFRNSLFLRLFKTRDENSIKLIFKDATLTEKKEIFSETGKYICEDLIESEEWDLLEYFVRECVTSKEEMIKFKEDIKIHKIESLWQKDEYEKRKDKWFKFLNMSI